MKALKSYIIRGIIFTSVLGTLFHFVYEWSGENFFIGLFTPINESIWEHTKLIFFPMLFYSLLPNKNIKEKYPCIDSALTSGGIFGVLSIIVLYYTYSGIIGFHTAVIDILIFYLSVILSFYIAYTFALSCKADKYFNVLQILQIIMSCLFMAFTLYPPDIPLFLNPLS